MTVRLLVETWLLVRHPEHDDAEASRLADVISGELAAWTVDAPVLPHLATLYDAAVSGRPLRDLVPGARPKPQTGLP
jgi:hypothetical protein